MWTLLVAGVLFFVGRVTLGPTLSTVDPWVQVGYVGAISALAALSGWRLSGIEPKPKAADRCPKCGYSLVGIASVAPCPECGSTPLRHSSDR